MFAFLPLSGCDSLWRGFTMDVPVIDPCAKVSCAAPLICTPPSGLCVDPTSTPLSFTSIDPSAGPMGGFPVQIKGGGFTNTTRVLIDGQPVLLDTPITDSGSLSGMTPKAKQVCVPLKLQLQRGSEPILSTATQVTYQFAPFTTQGQKLLYSNPDLPTQIISAQLDGNPKLDLLINFNKSAFVAIFNPDGINPADSATGIAQNQTPAEKVINLQSSTPGALSTIFGYQGILKYSYTFSKQGSTYAQIGSPFKSFAKQIRDAVAVNLEGDAGDEVVVIACDPGTSGDYYALRPTAMGPALINSRPASEELYAIAAAPSTTGRPADTLFVTGVGNGSTGGPKPGEGSVRIIDTNPGPAPFLGFFIGMLPDGLRTIAAGDLDGDTHPDFVTYSNVTGLLYIGKYADNYRSISKIDPRIGTGMAPYPVVDIQILDTNCDNRPDIVIAPRASQLGPLIFLNSGAGNFTTEAVGIIDGSTNQPLQSSAPFVIMDINGDPLKDIVTKNPTVGLPSPSISVSFGSIPQ
jgi:hypothetical protein